MDCEKGEGPEVAKKYGVRGYPTFVAVNAAGEVVDRWIGYGGAEAWSAAAAASAADPRTLAEKKAAFETAPTAALARSLAGAQSTEYDWAGAVHYFRKARDLDPDGARDYTEQILTFMYYGSRDGNFTIDEVEAEAVRYRDSGELAVDEKVQLAQMLNGMASGAGQPERAVPWIEAALAAAEGSDDESLARGVRELKIVAALLIEKDADKAVSLKRASMREGWQDDSKQLNRYAWWCFENGVDMEAGLEFALKGIDLAESDGDRASVLDTAAELCNALGNCGDAVDHIRRALELRPDSDYYKEQLARFEKALEEKKEG